MTDFTTAPSVAPVLSTPDTHIFEDPTPTVDTASLPRVSDEQLHISYEISRTIKEIREQKWRRIALQFPDHMLVDTPRVFQALGRGLREQRKALSGTKTFSGEKELEEATEKTDRLELESVPEGYGDNEEEEKLFILADTSYGACCVDEIAAEHVNADGVVHYGRSCLSPTARLPVIYVFTTKPLEIDLAVESFGRTYPSKQQKVILMADIPYSSHIPPLCARLRMEGYENVYETKIVHDPSSLLPNRTTPPEVSMQPELLRDYQLFHIAHPPSALLLTLSSRVGAVHIYTADRSDQKEPGSLPVSSTMALRRRYALLTSLSTCSIFGILINTLSVKNYLDVVEIVRKQIAEAGKKSYTFVVGKVNPAKVANFSEIGGWVVIGCWESSLVESKDFWRPLITPFELSLTLQSDSERIWTGEWRSDFQLVLSQPEQSAATATTGGLSEQIPEGTGDEDYDSEEESEPPEFDLRTGKYISHTRPMGRRKASTQASTSETGNGKMQQTSSSAPASSLIKRANGDLAQIGGQVSPAAEFLRSQRTWQGLGSDFADDKANGAGDGDLQGAVVEEGRSGLARGYVVGDDRTTH